MFQSSNFFIPNSSSNSKQPDNVFLIITWISNPVKYTLLFIFFLLIACYGFSNSIPHLTNFDTVKIPNLLPNPEWENFVPLQVKVLIWPPKKIQMANLKKLMNLEGKMMYFALKKIIKWQTVDELLQSSHWPSKKVPQIIGIFNRIHENKISCKSKTYITTGNKYKIWTSPRPLSASIVNQNQSIEYQSREKEEKIVKLNLLYCIISACNESPLHYIYRECGTVTGKVLVYNCNRISSSLTEFTFRICISHLHGICNIHTEREQPPHLQPKQ